MVNHHAIAFRRALFAIIPAALTLVMPLAAQIGGTGSIEGTVSDPSGAVIPAATVDATNVATGVTTTRQTTAAGYYVISALPAGEYSVKFNAGGFQSLVQQHVVVDALGTTALNVKMSVGSASEQVTVVDQPPNLDTADASMSQTIRNDVYTALPLTMGTGGATANAPRDPTSFVQYLPGVTNYGGNTAGSVNGGTIASEEVYVDGVATTSAVLQGEVRYLALGVSIEAVEQVQLQSAGSSVQFGGQGSTNYVIKSGTNQFHGLAYENVRNSDFDARGFFPSTKPVNKQNEFGGTFGGPIRKNKLFFFGAYTGYRTVQAATPTIISIPTLLERTGNFSELPVAIYDPASTSCAGSACTRSPFPGNMIPSSKISGPSALFQSFLPAPTSPTLLNNYLSTVPLGFAVNNYTVKIDYVLNSNHRLSGHYSPGNRHQTTLYRNGYMPLPYTPSRQVIENMKTADVKETWVVSSRILNELTLGFARFDVPIEDTTMLPNCGAGGAGEAPGVGQYCNQWMTAAGITGLPAGEATNSFPYLTFSGPNSDYSWRNGNSPAFNETLNNYTIQDNVQYTNGRHSVVVGMQYQWLQANEKPQTFGSFATWTFGDLETSGFAANSLVPQSTAGNSYASYLLGSLNSASVTDNANIDYGGRLHDASWWVQDNIKVKENLTLTLGVRHEIDSPWVEAADRMSWLNPSTPNPAIGGFPGVLEFAGNGPASCHCRNNMSTYPWNFQPRIGLAYSLNSKTVIRAGFTLNSIRTGAVGGTVKEGTGFLGYSANPVFSTLNGGATPAFYWQDGFPAYQHAPFFNPTLNTGFYTGTPQGGSITYGDPVLGPRPPRFENWNVSIQREIVPTLVLDVAYAASEGHHLSGGALGFWSDQLNPRYLVLGNLLNASATPANVAAAQAIVSSVALPYANYVGTISQMLRSFPQYSSVTTAWTNLGNTNYQSLQIVARKTFSHGLTAVFNYTWAKEMDDLSTYSGYVDDKSQGTNPASVINALVVYQLPFGKGQPLLGSTNRVVSALVSHWQVSGITTWRSGAGFGSIAASCTLPNAGSCWASYSPTFSGPVQTAPYGSGNLIGGTTTSYLNIAAFQNPAPYTYGTTPRTLAYGLRGPTYFNQNLSVKRQFVLHERLMLTLQADSINPFNNVSFSSPSTNIASASSFGRITSQANSPRDLQFGARITF
ncbi:MAG TPA: carboxypeptidase-like regulatory domain-containing protein [Bryobacteraceae bacterium]|nr:carboxypeptidase-like regulatory domain-containing protein [Bryobacteraceae bacterium]